MHTPLGTTTPLSNANPTITSTSPTVNVTVPGVIGTVTLQLVVTDNLGVQSAPATATVQIQGPPVAVLKATPNPVTEGGTITLSGADSAAASPGTIESYTFTLQPAPVVPVL